MTVQPRSCALLVTALLLASPAAASAEDRQEPSVQDLFQARVFQGKDGKKLPYRLLTPAAYDQANKYPLVLFLHGAGERGDDNAAQLVHGMKDFARAENREQHPCFVVAPQCPSNSSWADFRRTEGDAASAPTEPLRLTIELLDALSKEYSLDERRLYVTGLSMGGFGTWDLLARLPDRFSAAAPICGGGDPRQASKFARVPVWVFHGDQDQAVRVEASRAMVAALRKAGGRPLYTEYAGVGHDSWTATYASPLFLTWLFAQEK